MHIYGICRNGADGPTYLQGRNRDADIEDGLMDTAREAESVMNLESTIAI